MVVVEIEPKKSRSLVRVALGHYKELQDQAKSDPERAAIKKCFALSLYSGDAITSSYGRKTVLISQTDLINYFNFCGIIIPNFSDENLLKILEKLLDFSSVQFGEKAVRIKTATHAIGCWVWGSMRLWSTISARELYFYFSLRVMTDSITSSTNPYDSRTADGDTTIVESD